MSQSSECIAILWVSLVSFAAITICVASQRVFIVVYFVIVSVRKLLDTPSYTNKILLRFIKKGAVHQTFNLCWSFGSLTRFFHLRRFSGVKTVSDMIKYSEYVWISKVAYTKILSWHSPGDRKTMKPDIPADISTGYLPNPNPDRFRCTKSQILNETI
jgi:hypothetical protein